MSRRASSRIRCAHGTQGLSPAAAPEYGREEDTGRNPALAEEEEANNEEVARERAAEDRREAEAEGLE